MYSSYQQLYNLLNAFTDSLSPLRDPVYTRNRFEGLLEGAIKMYSVDGRDTTCDGTLFHDVPGAIRARDYRGRSAIVSMYVTQNSTQNPNNN